MFWQKWFKTPFHLKEPWSINFINPDRLTAASIRSEHVCTLVNADENIDAKTIMASSRHKSHQVHDVYKRRSKSELDKKTNAFHKEKYKTFKVSFIYFILRNYSLNVLLT